jgi:hypothetical protein
MAGLGYILAVELRSGVGTHQPGQLVDQYMHFFGGQGIFVGQDGLHQISCLDHQRPSNRSRNADAGPAEAKHRAGVHSSGVLQIQVSGQFLGQVPALGQHVQQEWPAVEAQGFARGHDIPDMASGPDQEQPVGADDGMIQAVAVEMQIVENVVFIGEFPQRLAHDLFGPGVCLRMRGIVRKGKADFFKPQDGRYEEHCKEGCDPWQAMSEREQARSSKYQDQNQGHNDAQQDVLALGRCLADAALSRFVVNMSHDASTCSLVT